MDKAYLESRIANARSRLAENQQKADALKLDKLLLEGEMRGYENVLAQLESEERQRGTAKFPTIVRHTPQQATKAHQFQLSVVWRDIFSAAVDAYPDGLTRDTVKEIARRHGPLSASFNTSIHHHVERGTLEKRDRLLFATEKTASRVGLTLSAKKIGDFSGPSENPPGPFHKGTERWRC